MCCKVLSYFVSGGSECLVLYRDMNEEQPFPSAGSSPVASHKDVFTARFTSSLSTRYLKKSRERSSLSTPPIYFAPVADPKGQEIITAKTSTAKVSQIRIIK